MILYFFYFFLFPRHKYSVKNLVLNYKDHQNMMNKIDQFENDCVKCKNMNNKKQPMQFTLCDTCQNNYALFSKSFCINELLLSKSDLEDLRYFIKGQTKLFLEEDIQMLIKKKYGDNDAYNHYKQQKISTKVSKQIQQQKLRDERKMKLIDVLSEYKLEYKTYGDCYTYVQYGYPELNKIIENELEKYKIIFSKKIEIINSGEQLNEQIGSEHYNYIHGISKNLNTVRNNENDEHMILFD